MQRILEGTGSPRFRTLVGFMGYDIVLDGTGAVTEKNMHKAKTSQGPDNRSSHLSVL